MDDLSVAHAYADVDDAALGVVEESEVVATDVAWADLHTRCYLLRSIAR